MSDNILPFPMPLREELIARGASLINQNLGDDTVHMFKPTLINWTVSPQLLCVYTTGELLYLREALDMEIGYRKLEMRA